MNWKKSFSVLTISLLLAMSSVTAKADETGKTETLSEVPVLTQAEDPKKNDDLDDKDLNRQTSNEEVEDIKNSTSVEVEIEEAKPATKVNAAADADPMRTFNIDDWDVNTMHDGVLIIGGLKNQNIKNIYIPSYVTIAGQERRVQFNDLSMFMKKEKDLKRFESIIFEAIGPDSNPTAVQKVILGTPAGEAISLSNVFANHPVLSNVDLKGLDVSRVTNISGIFGGSLSIRNLDVSNWDTSNVTSMEGAFFNTQTLLHIDLKDWDTSKVTNMSNMFKESGLWEVNFPNWRTGNVTTMSEMFASMPQLYETDFKNWDTSKVTDFSGMFAFTKGIRDLDLRAFNTSSATTMASMFYQLGSIQSLNLSSFDTRKVTDFTGMFGFVVVPQLDITNFDTGSAVKMERMFQNFSLLDSSGGGYGKIGKLDVSHFKMDNVETIYQMFYRSNLEELDVTKWNVAKVENANSAFSGMQNLKSINPGNWNTSGIKDISFIFQGTYLLEYIDLHNWEINITDTNNNRNLFLLGQYLQRPLIVKTSDPFLLGYNYAKDFRLTAGPKKLAMEGKFSDNTTSKSLFNRYTIQDEAELITSAADYNAFMHDLPTPTNPLLSFKEWQYKDEKNIRKVFVDKTESIDIRKDSTVYEAQYESHKLTVKFHVDDAITEVKTEPNTKVDQTKIPETDKTGYTFKGWVYLNEPAKPFDPATVVIVEDTEVKAVYEINKVKVTFDNEGDLTEATTDYNTAVKPADIPTVTKVGHTFKEWNTKADGTGVKFVGTELITEDRTVYAIYTVNQLSVTFNDEGTVNVQNVDYGTALKTNQIPTPVGKTGHTFKEWNTAPDGNGTKFVGTEVITSNTVVFAVYTVNEVSVTFINDTQLDTATTTYNNALNPSDIPTATKIGHSFVEWNTSPDGSGSEFVGTELITENRTVYAIFTANPVKVTFDNEGD
ncbi:MAG: BspA family leucine-rich repeat surface protein, partial [Erysipelothrix sp.]